MSILEKLFGANWRTSLYGSLTAILGFLLISNNVWVGWLQETFGHDAGKKIEGTIVMLGALMGINTARNMKDKTVSGTGSIETPYVKPDEYGGDKKIAPVIALFLIVSLGLCSCASTGPVTGTDLATKARTAATLVLLTQKDPAKRQQLAERIGMVGVALTTVAGDPSAAEIRDALFAKWPADPDTKLATSLALDLIVPAEKRLPEWSGSELARDVGKGLIFASDAAQRR